VFIMVLAVLGLALATGLALYFKDTDKPVVVLTPASGPVGPTAPFTVSADDPGSGLRSLTVTVTQQGKTATAVQLPTPSLPTAPRPPSPWNIRVRGVPPHRHGAGADASFGASTGQRAGRRHEFALTTLRGSVLSTSHNVTKAGP
jgi:hypothetical protein